MFIPPTAQEARKGEPPTIRVETTSRNRALKPADSPDMLTKAARLALAEARDNGYRAVAFDHVSEFIVNGDEVEATTVQATRHIPMDTQEPLLFEYVWMFTAWDQTDGNPEA